jgi:hypothetical protein
MLKWNAGKVKSLSGGEIWLFIVARVLVGFGLGALFAVYFPRLVLLVAIPAIAIGMIMFLLASKGMFRKLPNQDATP